jgi:fatty acid CoA ligase FadD22
LSIGSADQAANLASAMQARATGYGWLRRPAYLVGGEVVTHGDVHDGAARMASLLARQGVGPRDRVLIVMPDGLELVWAFLGTARLGAMAILVNPRLHADDHRVLAERYRPAVVVCGSELGPRFAPCHIVVSEGLADQISTLEAHPVAPVSPAEPAYAQLTSGTTGRPKAAVHRHADPFVYHRAFACGAIALDSEDVTLSVSKMHFAYGLGNSLFFPLLSGASAVLLPGHPASEAVAARVSGHRVSVLYAVPTFYAHLTGTDLAGSFTSLRVAVSAGEVLTPALATRVQAYLGCPVLDGLGSTEVGQTFVSNTLAAARHATVGRVLVPYEVSIRDPGGDLVPAGELGTLWVRGPTLFVEYLGEPSATAAMMREGWLCTGDRARMDADGYVSLAGRLDDIEMVGGISVEPNEIEQLLGGHPGVVEVAVAAVRDGAGASRLEAFAVPAPGAGDVLVAELVALARAGLAPYKVPRVVHLVEALPRTPTGKLRRFALRSGAWAD